MRRLSKPRPFENMSPDSQALWRFVAAEREYLTAVLGGSNGTRNLSSEQKQPTLSWLTVPWRLRGRARTRSEKASLRQVWWIA